MRDHPSLAAALAAFQAELPRVGKDHLASVRSDKGDYTYNYADLADVSHEALPKLAEHGLSFSAKPTLDDTGRFVLLYALRHVSGETDSGTYPLPTNGTAQQIGSAITYARRYCLCSVTGIAPDQDDDGQAANEVPAVPRVDPSAAARSRLAAVCKQNGWDLRKVAALYSTKHDTPLGEATDQSTIDRFRESLFSMPDADLRADAGVAA